MQVILHPIKSLIKSKLLSVDFLFMYVGFASLKGTPSIVVPDVIPIHLLSIGGILNKMKGITISPCCPIKGTGPRHQVLPFIRNVT